MGIFADNFYKKRPPQSSIEADCDALRKFLTDFDCVDSAYIFGSCATGTYRIDSDMDVAILIENENDYKGLKSKIYQGAPKTALPLEFVFILKSGFERKCEIGGLSWMIKKEGVLIYDKKSVV